ncbi:flagellar protein FlgN [bacterium]|nr:flagellar protein FlgN [bacterium]MBU1651784.1 flagellar protein FlgN [bacterium]MBU1882414.1 flagellar protein FlgN [bacterium]
MMSEATATSIKASHTRDHKTLDTFIQELVALIRDEEKVLNSFLNHLNHQKKYLLADDIEAFQGTVERQEDLIDEIKRLEQMRIAKVNEFALSQGMSGDEITLTHLIEMTLGDVSEELKALKEDLSGLVEKIRRSNRVNQMLVKRSLDFIQKNIGWMIDASDISQMYDPSGQKARQNGTNVLVNKVL